MVSPSMTSKTLKLKGFATNTNIILLARRRNCATHLDVAERNAILDLHYNLPKGPPEPSADKQSGRIAKYAFHALLASTQ